MAEVSNFKKTKVDPTLHSSASPMVKKMDGRSDKKPGWIVSLAAGIEQMGSQVERSIVSKLKVEIY